MEGSMNQPVAVVVLSSCPLPPLVSKSPFVTSWTPASVGAADPITADTRIVVTIRDLRCTLSSLTFRTDPRDRAGKCLTTDRLRYAVFFQNATVRKPLGECFSSRRPRQMGKVGGARHRSKGAGNVNGERPNSFRPLRRFAQIFTKITRRI